jgi:hypothetical protein
LDLSIIIPIKVLKHSTFNEAVPKYKDQTKEEGEVNVSQSFNPLLTYFSDA